LFARICSFRISVSFRFLRFFFVLAFSYTSFGTYHHFTLFIFASFFSATTCEPSTVACDFRPHQTYPLFRALPFTPMHVHPTRVVAHPISASHFHVWQSPTPIILIAFISAFANAFCALSMSFLPTCVSLAFAAYFPSHFVCLFFLLAFCCRSLCTSHAFSNLVLIPLLPLDFHMYPQ
jgi:hypothetical protein